jgi:hypothetical protein
MDMEILNRRMEPTGHGKFPGSIEPRRKLLAQVNEAAGTNPNDP